MPFGLCAVLSGLLFVIGLVGVLWRPQMVKAMSVVLMLQGAMLLFVATDVPLRQSDGGAMALLLLGLLPVELALGSRLWRRSASPVLGDDEAHG